MYGAGDGEELAQNREREDVAIQGMREGINITQPSVIHNRDGVAAQTCVENQEDIEVTAVRFWLRHDARGG